ncbi:MAG: response regulator [Janthinobacterium lividum]
MVRPCFLVIDREHAGSISTRKLVIETAKLNVITAFTGEEAIETLARYPAVDGIVMDASMPDMPCMELIARLKQMQPSTPLVLISTPLRQHCEGADHVLESFDPTQLLNLLRGVVPRSSHVMQGEERLSQQQV